MGTHKIKRTMKAKIEAEGVEVLSVEVRKRNPHIFYEIKYGSWPVVTATMGCSPGLSAESRFMDEIRRYKRYGFLKAAPGTVISEQSEAVAGRSGGRL